jgi:hypothetical protein
MDTIRWRPRVTQDGAYWNLFAQKGNRYSDKGTKWLNSGTQEGSLVVALAQCQEWCDRRNANEDAMKLIVAKYNT